MTRLLLRALVATFFLTSIVLAGCRSECEKDGTCEREITPPPEPGDPVYEEFLQNAPMTWGLKREILQQVFVTGPGLDPTWYEQVTREYWIVTWRKQSDGTYRQHEKACSMDTSEVYVMMPSGKIKAQVTVIPPELIASIDEDDWNFGFEVVDSDLADHKTVQYTLNPTEFGPQYAIWGADISDPVAEKCPADASESGWEDSDGDGNPGVTTEAWVDDEYYCSLMVCQRFLHRSYPGIVTVLDEGQYRIISDLYDIVVDQSQYGTLDEPFPQVMNGQDPEVRWDESYGQTYYIMTSLPDNATCSDVTSDLFQ